MHNGDGVEMSERCAAQQCVITVVEWDDVEDQVLAEEVVRRTKHHFHGKGARAAGLHTRITTLKVVLLGLILDGSIPIFLTVSA